MACRLRLIMRVTDTDCASADLYISYLMYMTMCFTCMLSLVNAIVYNYSLHVYNCHAEGGKYNS